MTQIVDSDSSKTPLYIAAQEGHEAIVRLLAKECGADVNKANHHGTTPLYIAAHNGGS